MITCKAILANRHIIPNGGCPVCQKGAEDVKHKIFSCDRARAVWSLIGVWEKVSHLLDTDQSGSIVLEEIIHRGEEILGLEIGLAELILTGGWYLWWEMPQLTHGEKVQLPSRSGLAILSLVKIYKMAAKQGVKL